MNPESWRQPGDEGGPRPLVPGVFSIAPMIDKTHRHFRHFLRLATRRAILYTEMITAPAIIHGKRSLLLDYAPTEHPIVLQLGADDPEQLYQAVRIARDWGYDEYNLNVGCPSDKVQQGRFGACLMESPRRVTELLQAMATADSRPVGIKHRVGITGHGLDLQAYEDLAAFIRQIRPARADRYIVHARIAILEGLSPRDNRSVPPLRYPDVWRLKAENPDLHMEINGNIQGPADFARHLDRGMDGIMLGRVSYENPRVLFALDELDRRWQTAGSLGDLAGSPLEPDFAIARDLVLEYGAYMDTQAACGLHPRSLVWPVLELFHGIRGARRYKQLLSAPFAKGQSMVELFGQALSFLQPATQKKTLPEESVP